VHDSLEERVYSLVAEERGMPREELSAGKTLSYDLGMEGDDAVEFFENFERQFNVDLTNLWLNWNRYFAPEGVAPQTALVVLGPGALIGLGLGQAFPRLSTWLCFGFGMVLWVVPFYYFVHRRSRDFPQISVQDLIDCAKAGHWSKLPPPKDRIRSFLWL
jgi:hypothetical protein